MAACLRQHFERRLNEQTVVVLEADDDEAAIDTVSHMFRHVVY